MHRNRSRLSRQHGAVLLFVLLVVLGVLLIGVSAVNLGLMDEKAAQGEGQRQLAFRAAEAALLDAQADIEGGRGGLRAALFVAGAQGFVAGCGNGRGLPNQGLCLPADSGPPLWQALDLAGPDSADAHWSVYGQFTGAHLADDHSVHQPRYIIERVALAIAGEDAARWQGHCYRITAIGFGRRAGTEVVLQSFYRKTNVKGDPP